MGRLQGTRKRLVSANWIIYSWSILTLLAAICRSSLAGPVNDGLYDDYDSTPGPLPEGSGHGGLLDVLGISDDDNIDDNDEDTIRGGFDDDGGGGGGDGEGGGRGGSAMMPAGHGMLIDTMKITCYHCLGDGTRGCDVVSMLQKAESYSITCIGKCLNISSGLTAVYDCAHDMAMASRTDTCLKNGDTEMCFCSENLCNGPGDIKKFFSHSKTPFFFQKQHVTFPKSQHEDYDYDYYGETDYQGNGTSSNSYGLDYNFNENRTATDYEYDYDYDNDSELAWKNLSSGMKEKETGDKESGSHEEGLSVTKSKHSKNEDKDFPYVQETEIDVIIPAGGFVSSDNSTTTEENGTPEPVDIKALRVGNLLNGGDEIDSVSGENSAVELKSQCVVVLVYCVLMGKLLL